MESKTPQNNYKSFPSTQFENLNFLLDIENKNHIKKKRKKNHISEEQKIQALEKEHRKTEDRLSQTLWVKQDDENLQYKIDIKGDPDNRVFEQLIESDIPKYSRLLNNYFILGCFSSFEITKTILSSLKYKFKPFNKSHFNDTLYYDLFRYFSQKYTMTNRDKTIRRIKLFNKTNKDSTTSINVLDDPFISLDINHSEILKEESFEEYLIRYSKKFNIDTMNNPNDIMQWINFVYFQDECFLDKRQLVLSKTEKKIAIIEKSLEYNPNNHTLITMYQHLCEKYWEPKRFFNIWKKILAKYSNNYKLWIGYIRYCSNSYKTCTISKIRYIYSSIIQYVIMKNINKDRKIIEEIILFIFYHMSIFEKQAGYYERAIKIFQAQIEYNVFRPNNIKNNLDLINNFELYWEYDCDKIGSNNATNWNEWNNQYINKTIKCNNESINKNRDLNGLDIESIIMFNDISGILYDITSKELKQELIFQFLSLLGVNKSIIKGERRSSSNSFLSQQYFENLEDFEDIMIKFIGNNKINNSKLFNHLSKYKKDVKKEKSASIKKIINNVINDTLFLFSDSIVMKCIAINLEAKYNGLKKGRNLARKYLSSDRSNLDLWNLLAQIENKYGKLKDCVKIYTKMLSSNHKNDIYNYSFIYWFYFKVELEIRNIEVEKDKQFMINILLSCIEGQLSDKKINSIRIVKCKNKYKNILLDNNDNHLWKYINNYNILSPKIYLTICYTWLEILTSDLCEIENIYKRIIKPNIFKMTGGSGGAIHEWIIYEYCNILKRFFVDNLIKIKDFTMKFLTENILIFPLNIELFAFLVQIYNKVWPKLKLRQFFYECQNKYTHKSPYWTVLKLFQLIFEIITLDKNNDNVRNIFEDTFKSPISNNCIVLWRLYMYFELWHDDIDKHNDKDNENNYQKFPHLQEIKDENTPKEIKIFYRAINSCSRSKKIWMDSIHIFKNSLDIPRIISLMKEKEIRVTQEDFEI